MVSLAWCLSNICDKGFSAQTLFGEHSRGIINKLRRQTVAEKVNIFAPFVFHVLDFYLDKYVSDFLTKYFENTEFTIELQLKCDNFYQEADSESCI